jgi:hypothetical protein
VYSNTLRMSLWLVNSFRLHGADQIDQTPDVIGGGCQRVFSFEEKSCSVY